MKFLNILAINYLLAQAWALSIGGKHMVIERDSDSLQDIVSGLDTLSENDYSIPSRSAMMSTH